MARVKYKGYYIVNLGDSGFFAFSRVRDIGKNSVVDAGRLDIIKKKIDSLKKKRIVKRK